MKDRIPLGWWQNNPVEVIKGPTTGLPIPAQAEIVLEGEMVSPDVETRIEGPFPEFTGHYTKPAPEPAFRVKSILHRNDPIIFGALHWLGPGVNRDHLPFMRSARIWSMLDELVPGVKGVWIPPEMEPAMTIISLEQKYSGHAKQAALAALSIESFMRRYVVVVDHDVDPYNLNEVLHALSFRAEPEEFDIVRGWRGAGLNPRLAPEKRARGENTMSTAIILACRPFHWMKDFPLPVKPDLEYERAVREKWQDL